MLQNDKQHTRSQTGGDQEVNISLWRSMAIVETQWKPAAKAAGPPTRERRCRNIHLELADVIANVNKLSYVIT